MFSNDTEPAPSPSKPPVPQPRPGEDEGLLDPPSSNETSRVGSGAGTTAGNDDAERQPSSRRVSPQQHVPHYMTGSISSQLKIRGSGDGAAAPTAATSATAAATAAPAARRANNPQPRTAVPTPSTAAAPTAAAGASAAAAPAAGTAAPTATARRKSASPPTAAAGSGSAAAPASTSAAAAGAAPSSLVPVFSQGLQYHGHGQRLSPVLDASAIALAAAVAGNPQPVVTSPAVARPSSFNNFSMAFVRDHALAASRLSAAHRSGGGAAASSVAAAPQRPPFFLERGLVDSTSPSSSLHQNNNSNNAGAAAGNAAGSGSSRITIRCMAVVEDRVWAGEKDGRLSVFDAKTGELRRRFERKSEYFPYCIALVPPYVWVGFNDGSLRAFDADSLGCVKEAKEHSGPVHCIEAPAGCGRRGADDAFTAGADFMIVRWSAVTVERISAINAHQGLLRALSWLPQADMLLSGGDDGSLKGWTVQTDENDPSSPPGLVACRPDAHARATATHGAGGSGASTGGILSLVTCQHLVWTAGGDGVVRVWEIVQQDTSTAADGVDNPTEAGVVPLAPAAGRSNNDDAAENKTRKASGGGIRTQQTHFQLVHEIRAPHTHSVSRLLRVGDTVWSVCLGNIFVWAGQEPFDEMARFVGEHAGYVTSCAVVRESAVARVWSAGAEGGFCVWNAESELVPAARLGYDALAQLTPLQPMTVAPSAATAAAAASALKQQKRAAALASTNASTRRATSAADRLSPITADPKQQQQLASVGIQCELSVLPTGDIRSASVASLGMFEDAEVSGAQHPQATQQQQQQQASSTAVKPLKVATVTTTKSSVGGRAASPVPPQPKKLPGVQQPQQAATKTGSTPRSESKDPQPARGGSAVDSSIVKPQQQRSGTPVSIVTPVSAIPEPSTPEEAILLSRRVLRKFGVPTDETWRTLLCSTMFSTRLDAEAVRRNTDPKTSGAIAVDIDISSMKAIMASLHFLAEEQQRRLHDIAQMTGARKLRQLVDRSVDGGETQLPLSVLCLDDWAFANRVWTALFNRAYLLSVVQNEGVAAVTPASTAAPAAVAASSSSSSSPRGGARGGSPSSVMRSAQSAAAAAAASSGGETPQQMPDASAEFGVTVVPAKLANAIAAKFGQQQQQQQQQPSTSVASRGGKQPPQQQQQPPSPVSAGAPPPSLSSAVEGVAVERRALLPDTAAFSTEESTAQLYSWLEKQRQQILDALHACTSRPLASDANILVLEERAARERIANEQLTIFANICLVKVTFVEKRQQVMMSASPMRRREQQIQRASAGAPPAPGDDETTTVVLSDGTSVSRPKLARGGAAATSASSGGEEQQRAADVHFTVDGSAGMSDEAYEDLCVAINAASQLLIAQHRQSTRAVLAEYGQDLDDFSQELGEFHERMQALQEQIEQQRQDAIARTREMHQLSLALAESMQERDRLQAFIDKSDNAAAMSYLQEQVRAAKEELAEEREEVARMRQINVEMARDAHEKEQQHAEYVQRHEEGGDDASAAGVGGRRSPLSAHQQQQTLQDRCRWLATLVNEEVGRRPGKEQEHRQLLEEMQTLEVAMAEKQDSSVVRQRHAAKTLSVDLQSAEVSREVALEMVRLLRTRVEFFEERDAQWSRLAELLGDVARMHIDSFVFSEALDELQRAAKELLQVLDLRSTVGRAAAELFRLMGDIMRATADFRGGTEQRPPTRAQLSHFLERQEHRVGVAREGVRWILANFFSEPELLHLGLSPQLFLPDDRRLKPPVPPSLMNMADMIALRSSGAASAVDASSVANASVYIDPWIEPSHRPPQAGAVAMVERVVPARGNAHPYVAAPAISDAASRGNSPPQAQPSSSSAIDALRLRGRQPLDATFSPPRSAVPREQ